MLQARGTRARSTRQSAAVVAAMSGMRTFCGARDIYDALRGGGHNRGSNLLLLNGNDYHNGIHFH